MKLNLFYCVPFIPLLLLSAVSRDLFGPRVNIINGETFVVIPPESSCGWGVVNRPSFVRLLNPAPNAELSCFYNRNVSSKITLEAVRSGIGFLELKRFQSSDKDDYVVEIVSSDVVPGAAGPRLTFTSSHNLRHVSFAQQKHSTHRPQAGGDSAHRAYPLKVSETKTQTAFDPADGDPVGDSGQSLVVSPFENSRAGPKGPLSAHQADLRVTETNGGVNNSDTVDRGQPLPLTDTEGHSYSGFRPNDRVSFQFHVYDNTHGSISIGDIVTGIGISNQPGVDNGAEMDRKTLISAPTEAQSPTTTVSPNTPPPSSRTSTTTQLQISLVDESTPRGDDVASSPSPASPPSFPSASSPSLSSPPAPPSPLSPPSASLRTPPLAAISPASHPFLPPTPSPPPPPSTPPPASSPSPLLTMPPPLSPSPTSTTPPPSAPSSSTPSPLSTLSTLPPPSSPSPPSPPSTPAAGVSSVIGIANEETAMTQHFPTEIEGWNGRGGGLDMNVLSSTLGVSYQDAVETVAGSFKVNRVNTGVPLTFSLIDVSDDFDWRLVSYPNFMKLLRSDTRRTGQTPMEINTYILVAEEEGVGSVVFEYVDKAGTTSDRQVFAFVSAEMLEGQGASYENIYSTGGIKAGYFG
eukprot:GHVN01012830.1.p2 GENE.GHVN01012830.1~~GHVN01012830.1.p2  ORF type:complete len:633 (-),score=131.02 GHVN01012830.1:2038-3936(-)